MRLTVYADYALRVLMFAALHPDRLCTIGEISRAYGISRNHVMKVVYELRVAGYIATVRGQQGGFSLARPPQEIVVGKVIRRMEHEVAIVPCLEAETGYCAISPACKLRRALQQATSAFFAVLDGYTLADLVEKQNLLRALLSPDAPASERTA
jgi:Rrf2 family nitric oxide-sensitive transcriptional repressor